MREVDECAIPSDTEDEIKSEYGADTYEHVGEVNESIDDQNTNEEEKYLEENFSSLSFRLHD